MIVLTASDQTVSRNKVITGILSAMVIAPYVIIMIYFSEIIHFTSPFQVIIKVKLSSVGSSIIAATDILIAAALVVLLGWKRSAFERTNSVLNSLIVYSIASGAVTALCAIATPITAQILPETFIYLTLALMLAKRMFSLFRLRDLTKHFIFLHSLHQLNVCNVRRLGFTNGS